MITERIYNIRDIIIRRLKRSNLLNLHFDISKHPSINAHFIKVRGLSVKYTAQNKYA